MAEEKRTCTHIYGAMCFAGSSYPGYGCIVGESQPNRYSKPEFHLIAECEQRSTKDLITACSSLDLKHLPFIWYGDTDDEAGRKFLWELKEELERKYLLPGIISQKLQMQRRRGAIELTKSAIVDMAEPYHYILPVLRELLNQEHRRLFLPNRTAIKSQMRVLKKVDNIGEIQLRDFPAVSALGIACIELSNRPDLSDVPDEDDGWDEWRD